MAGDRDELGEAAVVGHVTGCYVLRVERRLTGTTGTVDVQASVPEVQLGLSRAGVTGVQKAVRMQHGGRDALVSAEIDCFVDLDPARKGVHMSRFPELFEEAIDKLVIGEMLLVEQLAEHIARHIVARQDALRAEVKIAARYPIERTTPVTGLRTQELVTLIGLAAASRTGSREEFGPADLVEQARMAEQAGFRSLWISDHFHPWNDAQGQSPFVWSVLGALSEAVSLPVETAVTCPTVRTHPAVVAQAAATTAVMTEGRFRLGVGSGEALNEHILGHVWPPAHIRLEMLEESIQIMRRLFTGEEVNHHGTDRKSVV